MVHQEAAELFPVGHLSDKEPTKEEVARAERETKEFRRKQMENQVRQHLARPLMPT